MFWKSEKFQQKYYNFFYDLFKFEKIIKLVPVDFVEPWYQVILKQKWAFLLEIFSEVIQAVYSALTPLILSKAIFDRNIWIIIYYALGYLILEILNRIILQIHIIFVIQSSMSIANEAYKFFLTVDPIFHTTKSSGQIISKISRGADDLDTLLNQFAGNILPVVTGFITVIITIGSYDKSLAAVGLIAFIAISFTNGSMRYINSIVFKKKTIQVQDKISIITVENLQQNQLIRSAFVTPEQIVKTEKAILKSMAVRSTAAFGYSIAKTITRILYIASILILSIMIFNLVDKELLEQGLAVTLIITYVNGSSQILKLGQSITDFVEKYARVTELFEFIRNFGKQTYPVLEGDETRNIS